MTETEKRRIDLLQETRKIYSDKYAPPAVHPRYQTAYHSIYKNDTMSIEENKNSSLGVRTLIAILLFALFIIAGKNGMEETETVMQEIKQDAFVDFQIFH